MRLLREFLIAAGGALLFPSVLLAADGPDDWVGKWGTVKVAGAKLTKDGATLTERVELGENFKVTKVKGDELWAGTGWIKSRDVLPYDKAIGYFSDQIARQPSARTYHDRATVYFEREKYDKAIVDETEAIRLDPKFAAALCNRGAAYCMKQEDDEALLDFNAAIRLDCRCALAYCGRANVFAVAEEYDKAIAELDEAIRLNPTEESFFELRATIYYRQGLLDKTVADLNAAIRLDPENARPFMNRGGAWASKGDFKKGIADLNKAIELDPEYRLAYYNRAVVRLKGERYDQVVADLTEAIRLDRKDEDSLRALAWIRATCPVTKFRSGKEAVILAERACELSEWREAEQIDTLAAACAEQGEFSSAVAWEKKAIELVPTENDTMRANFHARLELYKSGKPYRDVPKAR